MNSDKLMNVSGNLLEEVEECKRILEEANEEKAITHTSSCGTFLTLICC